MRAIRRASQSAFLLFFLYLLVRTNFPLEGKIRPEIFLRFDPYLALATASSSREFLEILRFFWVSLFMIVVAVFFGRAFCGWACPLGTTFDVVDRAFLGRLERPGQFNVSARVLKYLILLSTIVASLGALQLAGWFDPLSFATRLYALVLYPAADFAMRSLLSPMAIRAPLAGSILSWLKEKVLYFKAPVFQGGIVFFLIFLAVMLAHLYQNRFWCRNICPLGALLGIVGRLRFLKPVIGERCIDCERCERECPTGAIEKVEGSKRHVHAGECTQCFTCHAICPVQAIDVTFRPAPRPEGVSMDLPSRRAFLEAAFLGLLSIPLVKLSFTNRVGAPPLIRPPGALPEEEFLTRCVRCGQCMRVCPENAIQPTFGQAGLVGLWTPTLVPVVGYCLYDCAPESHRYDNLCGEVCPSGAIRKLTSREKHSWRMGTAFIDRSKCIPWVQGVSCGVCEEHCPVPGKAIIHVPDKVQVGSTEGLRDVLLPYVIEDRCTGCGICENKCPVEGRRAITVERLQV